MYLKSRAIALFSLTVVISACSHSQNKLSFSPLTMLFRTDTSGTGERQSITRFEEYLVNNYVDDKDAEKQIDSFAFKNVSPNVKAYTDYHIIFYKRTAQTTEETIRSNKNWIPPESLADMIFDYSWYWGKFSARSKFRNGKIVDSPDNINVTNVSIDSTQKN